MSKVSSESLRKHIEGRSVVREKIPTSVEIPFSPQTQHTLQFAAEEADRLRHSYIGTEHLLLGLLREERSVAGAILIEHGLHVETVRQLLIKLLNETGQPGRTESGEVSAGLNRIQALVDQLATAQRAEQSDALVAGIRSIIERLKGQIGEV